MGQQSTGKNERIDTQLAISEAEKKTLLKI
jgi:hypothetical protein